MRIKKQGIDYFPIETGILGDARIRIVMKNGGDAAFTVIIALLAQIYGTNGYYIAADEDLYKNIEVLLFELSRQKIKKIIAMAIDEGIFSKEMFTTHSIITSAQIQEQFFFSTQRRNSHKVMPQYLLIEESSLPRKSRNDMPTPKNTDDTEAEKRLFDEETECNNNTIADKNPENACNGTHSKEEQSINNTPSYSPQGEQ